LTNCVIKGFRAGIVTPANSNQTVPYGDADEGRFIVDNCTLANRTNVVVPVPTTTGGTPDLQRKRVDLKHIYNETIPGDSTHLDLYAGFTLGGTIAVPNFAIRDAIFLYDWNRSGVNYRVYRPEQAPDHPFWATSLNGEADDDPIVGQNVYGCPTGTNSTPFNAAAPWSWTAPPMKTNQQCVGENGPGKAFGGEIAACSTTRSGILGFMCATGEGGGPARPTGLRLVPGAY
jgi:hypothetical protein